MVVLSLNMFMRCQSEYDGGLTSMTTKIAKRQKTQKKIPSCGCVSGSYPRVMFPFRQGLDSLARPAGVLSRSDNWGMA
jgi:hypothetical protein